jgi:hypothetical protein
MSDTESNSTINEEINESIEVDDGETTKSLQKPKKPRTEAQKEALKRAQIKRAQNIEKRKKEKEIMKLEKEQEKLNKKKATINPSNNGFNEDFDTEDLIKQNEELLKKLALKNINKKPKQKKPVKQTIIYESDSSETEEEEIIIKKKPRHKKKNKKQKKVVYESESSSEEDTEEEEPQVTKKLQRQKSVKQPSPAPQYQEQYYEPPRKLKYADVFRFN